MHPIPKATGATPLATSCAAEQAPQAGEWTAAADAQCGGADASVGRRIAEQVTGPYRRADAAAFFGGAQGMLWRYRPQQAWADPSGRWALFERDVEPLPDSAWCCDGPKLRQPYFFADLHKKHAWQLNVDAYDYSRQPPRLSCGDGVWVEHEATAARIGHGQDMLQLYDAPQLLENAHTVHMERLPYLPRPAVSATLANGQRLSVDQSCHEHGPMAMRLHLNATPYGVSRHHLQTATVDSVDCARDGSLQALSCRLGALHVGLPGRIKTAFWRGSNGAKVPLLQLTLSYSLARGGLSVAAVVGQPRSA